jgi:hypothetical protein
MGTHRFTVLMVDPCSRSRRATWLTGRSALQGAALRLRVWQQRVLTAMIRGAHGSTGSVLVTLAGAQGSSDLY